MESTLKKIEKMVVEGGEGKVYFPSDFFDCGSEKAVSKALQRLVKSEVLMRMYRGIYCSPTIDTEWGMGRLSVGADTVAQAIAKRDCIRLGPSIGRTQNALGLSEQVPINPVYTTDGPSRRIYYKKGCAPLVFQHIPQKMFGYQSKIVMMTVIALTDIKKEHLWECNLDKIKSIYKQVPLSEIQGDLKKTPLWIRKVILSLYDN